MARDEISSFTIHDYESSNIGTHRVYNFSFDLDKDIVVFSVNAQISYLFDNMSGWVLGNFTFSPELTSIAGFEGTRWAGTYLYQSAISGRIDGLLTLEIIEVTTDGAYRAIVSSDTPRAFSQSLTGVIDLTNLNMTFYFEEWIVEPDMPRAESSGRYSFDGARSSINLQNTEISNISNIRSVGLRSFTVTLTDEPVQPLPDPDNDDE
jgi:hypothetical protein